MSGEQRPSDIDLSIIIVNHRTWSEVARCFESLRYMLESPSRTVELIIVNNSEDDRQGLPAVLKDSTAVRIIQNNGNHGYAHGCNLGAREARGSELLFLNPDVRDPGNGIEQFLAAKEAVNDAAIMTVRQVDRRGRPQRVFGPFPTALTLISAARFLLRVAAPGEYPDPRRAHAGLLSVDWVSGSALMISRDAFDVIGGWSEDYWLYSEDVDLCRRARDAGLNIVYFGGATLEHRHGGATRQDPQIAAMARSEVVISRHLYAHRHLRTGHAAIYHLLLFISRFVPLSFASLFVSVWPAAPEQIRVRAAVFRHLRRHYQRIIVHHEWLSPRSVNFRDGSHTARAEQSHTPAP